MSTLAEQIRSFVLAKFPLAKKRGLTNNDNLLDSGIVDSLGILDLVSFVEQEFHITVADDELIPENFQSLDSITAFVENKRGVAAAQQEEH